MKRFTHNNDSFICDVCGTENPPATGTCRNHCYHCLTSKHVDNNPGDRASSCQGIMRLNDVEFKGGTVQALVFKCEKCQFVRKNKLADDDNRELIYDFLEKKSRA